MLAKIQIVSTNIVTRCRLYRVTVVTDFVARLCVMDDEIDSLRIWTTSVNGTKIRNNK